MTEEDEQLLSAKETLDTLGRVGRGEAAPVVVCLLPDLGFQMEKLILLTYAPKLKNQKSLSYLECDGLV